ncbi:MAG: hypothetical protein GQ569_15260 [Methylococcaceae bacterium]|nr:hypothetical protein [Methylococcaceae bacterium]
MTPEQKRERLLKRVLPALGVTIIYFVFISGVLSEKMTKAEEKYQNLMRSGVSKGAMSGVMNQQSQTQQQIHKLEAENKKHTDKLKALAGFLSTNTSSNTSATLLSTILAKHNIKIQKEERETIEEAQLNTSLKEVWKWLKPPENKSKNKKEKIKVEPIYVQHLWLKGSYQAIYQAMNEIANSELQALPVSFTMLTPETDDVQSGDLEWELILWM